MRERTTPPRIPLILGALLLLLSATAAQAADSHGFLGVTLQDLSPSMAKALDLKAGSGVIIDEIVDGSPAEKAGLEDGDVILQFDGQKIEGSRSLTRAVRKTRPGDKVKVVVLRDGKKKTIPVEIGERDDDVVFFDKGDAPDADNDNVFVWKGRNKGPMAFAFSGANRGFMGVSLDDLNPQLGEYFGIKDGKGALITNVNEDSPAAEAGLKAGDVILKIGDEEVASASDVHDALKDTEPGDKITVEVLRKKKHKDITVTLGEMPDNAYAFTFGDDEGNGWRSHLLDRLHAMPDPDAQIQRLMRRHHEGDRESRRELKELKEELEQMRADLQELQKELKEK